MNNNFREDYQGYRDFLMHSFSGIKENHFLSHSNHQSYNTPDNERLVMNFLIQKTNNKNIAAQIFDKLSIRDYEQLVDALTSENKAAANSIFSRFKRYFK